MTSNQIEAKKARETERSNKEKEAETRRSNIAKETETKTANRLKFASDLLATGANFAGKFIPTASRSSKGNDASWYNKDKQMVDDTAKVSFSTPLGSEQTRLSDMDETTQGTVTSRVVKYINATNPGVMVLKYVPTLGNKSTAQVAGLNIYAYVRHANSGSRNYEYQDMMKYLLAVDSIYIGITELKRIYSILNTYKGHSRYYSEGYLRALGFNANAARVRNINIAALRYSINQLVLKVNSLYIPNVMSYYLRHTWMSGSIYKDSEIQRSQTYMYSADYLYEYNENVESKGFGALVPYKFITDTDDLETVISKLSRSLDILMRSEDIGIMSGDILKAYGESEMFFIPSIPEDFHIEEIFNLEVLSQIQNASVLGPIYPASFMIYEDPTTHELNQGYYSDFVDDDIKEALNITGNTLPLVKPHNGNAVAAGKTASGVSHQYGIINMYKDNPTTDDIMVSTRLSVITDARIYPRSTSGAYEYCQRILSNGSEIITEAKIVAFQETEVGSGIMELTVHTLWDGQEIYPSSTNTEFFKQFLVNAFDWAPVMRFCIQDTSDGNRKYYPATINVDICNYTTINAIDLDRMHRTALLSEFGVPLLGTKVRTR